jgi:hypothetical protein
VSDLPLETAPEAQAPEAQAPAGDQAPADGTTAQAPRLTPTVKEIQASLKGSLKTRTTRTNKKR